MASCLDAGVWILPGPSRIITGMRRIAFILMLAAGTVAFGQAKKSVAGVWKPGIEAGKLTAAQKKTVANAKLGLANASLKLKADKTFGLSMAGRVLTGTYAYANGIVTITVKEIVGKTKSEVAKMPASEKTGKFQMMKDGRLVSLPIKPPAKLVWRKIGDE